MVFAFLRRRRRAKLLEEPFPHVWEDMLKERFQQYSTFPVDLRRRLRDRTRIFVAEKYWEGVNGFDVTEEMQVVIAAMACTLTLAFDDDDAFFASISRVLLYPDTIARRMKQSRIGPVVTESDELHLGEAWSVTNSLSGGVIVLAWSDVLRGGGSASDGRNVVFHEFAHALDMSDGAVEGIPALGSRAAEEEWLKTLRGELDALRHDYGHGYAIPIDPYGLTNEAEFFAVSTESFFERPRLLQLKLPRLYELLNSYYRLHPAEW